jgi:hypothetical protein
VQLFSLDQAFLESNAHGGLSYTEQCTFFDRPLEKKWLPEQP